MKNRRMENRYIEKEIMQKDFVCRQLVLEGESGCGKTTLIRTVLRADAEKAGGFITARIKEQDILKGFVLAPVKLLKLPVIRMEDAVSEKLPCFLSFCGEMQQEDNVFTKYAVEYLQQAGNYPFAVLDEMGGIELLEDEFYEEFLSFLQMDLPWICVLKSKKSAEAMSRRVPLGERYWERYRVIRERLENTGGIQKVVMHGAGDIYAEQVLQKWKDSLYT